METSIGVVSMNLPVMSPLFRRYILGRTLRTTTGWTSYGTGRNRVKSSVVNSSSHTRHSTESTRPFEADETANPPGNNNIMVTTEVNVSRNSQPYTELEDLAAADARENHRHPPWRQH